MYQSLSSSLSAPSSPPFSSPFLLASLTAFFASALLPSPSTLHPLLLTLHPLFLFPLLPLLLASPPFSVLLCPLLSLFLLPQSTSPLSPPPSGYHPPISSHIRRKPHRPPSLTRPHWFAHSALIVEQGDKGKEKEWKTDERRHENQQHERERVIVAIEFVFCHWKSPCCLPTVL